ncbi:MAG: sce7726 family protein [Halomonas sp.]|nr:sce7726 family protein [Halomonas sp.]MBP5979337.1 sce7726 family protein [Halomonas sp.]
MTEIEIKKLLVHYAISNYSDCVLGAEVPFQFGERRADLAVLTCNLFMGFEIKSKNDKTDRLAYQNKSYKGFFDYCILVCEKQNLKEIRRAIPDTFGIFLASENGLVKIRKPKMIKRHNKLLLTSTLSVSKLKKIPGTKHLRSKYEMCKYISEIKTMQELRALAKEDFLEKYGPASRLIKKEIISLINSDDILTITKKSPTKLIRRTCS